MTIPNFIIWKTNRGPLLLSSPHPLTELQKMETRTMHLILREQELRIKELKIMR